MTDAQPQAAPPKDVPRSRQIALTAALTAVALGLDLWSKAWAWENLRTGPSRVLIERWAYFEFGFNTGSAFSLLRDASWARALFIAVTLAALVYMARLAASLPTRFASGFAAIGLISGGALGNLHDRLFRVMEVGSETRYGVVDFIKVYYWPGKPWPTFNVADIALVIGVALLLIYISRHGEQMEAAVSPAAPRPDPAP
jgi:signal peptidase II